LLIFAAKMSMPLEAIAW